MGQHDTKHPNYLPSPEIIKQRAQTVKWLQDLGFNSRFICSVMQHQIPDIELVKKMVLKDGAEQTFYKLLPFLAKTEYDKECSNTWKSTLIEEEEEEEEEYYDNDY